MTKPAASGSYISGALLSLLMLAGVAQAQVIEDPAKYPSKPVHVIVPFAPGGASDYAMRLIQPWLSKHLGQQLVVENRGGASGNIGMELAARAAPDGYTLFFGNIGTISINPHFYPELKVDPARGFIPISIASETAGILIASPRFKANSVKELVAYAKANPGKVNYAAAGISTLNTLAMEKFRKSAGLDMAQIPYKGGAGPAVADLIAGNVDVMFVTLSSAVSHVKDGKLKGLAVTTKERSPSLPNVPTLVEAGYPDEVSSSWQGLFAVAGTPKPIVDKIHAAVLKAMADPEVRKLMTNAAMNPVSSASPEEFKKFLEAESVRWKVVVEQLKAGAKK